VAYIWRFEVVAFNSLSGQEQVSSLHYQTDVPVAGSEPSGTTVLNQLLEHYSSSAHNLSIFRACAYSACTFTECRVRQEVEWWNGEIGSVATESIGLSGTLGSVGTSATPSGLCPWISLKADVASRSARGGLHLPGPFSALALGGDGSWNTGGTLYANINTLATSIEDALEDVFGGTGDINPVIYSPTRRRRGQSPFAFQVADARPSSEPRYLRRRMRET